MKKILQFIICTFALLFLTNIKVGAYQGEYTYRDGTFYFYAGDKIKSGGSVTIHILAEPSEETGVMEHISEGVYRYNPNFDISELLGKEYYYTICYDSDSSSCHDVIDIFAKYINSDGTRNVIHNLDNIISPSSEYRYVSDSQRVIYSVNPLKYFNKLKSDGESIYQTMIKKGINYNGKDYGFDYIAGNGVSTVELANMYSKYNYFSPNEEYSNNSKTYTKINELKEVVKEYSSTKEVVIRTNFLTPSEEMKNNLNYISEDFITSDGKINLNNEWMKRYILDVYEYWVKEYKVEGFYIEDINLYSDDVYNEIVSRVKKIYSNTLFYASSKTKMSVSDELQSHLFGMNTNEYRMINGTSKQDFDKLIHLMSSNLLNEGNNRENYINITNKINNFGSETGIDLYTKLILHYGNEVNKTTLINKGIVFLNTVMLSGGTPRIIAGSELLMHYNPTNEEKNNSALADKMICNQDKSICQYYIENYDIDWYLLSNSGEALRKTINARNNGRLMYFNGYSMNYITNAYINEELANKGIFHLTLKYAKNNSVGMDYGLMVINFSNKTVVNKDLIALGGDSIVSNIELDGEKLIINENAMYLLASRKKNILPSWVYLVIIVLIFVGLYSFKYFIKKKLGDDNVEKTEGKGKNIFKRKKYKIYKDKDPFSYLKGDDLFKIKKENKDKENKVKEKEDGEDKEIKEVEKESKENTKTKKVVKKENTSTTKKTTSKKTTTSNKTTTSKKPSTSKKTTLK